MEYRLDLAVGADHPRPRVVGAVFRLDSDYFRRTHFEGTTI